ncbi:MAG: PEP-CTERM sorting domain-containing protein [Planctomycetes bacterium]|nr:PEP-CTERM sorting domain-containing protein [Planctomycetota bacterium]
MKKILVSMAILMFAAISAQAAPAVTYTLVIDPGPGTFQITADVSQGDNAGLATYGMDVVGFSTMSNLGPMVDGFADGFLPCTKGFNLFRSADNVSPLGAGQDTITPGAVLVYGFGQAAGDISPPGGWAVGPPHTEVQSVYDATLVLASGTFPVGVNPSWGQSAAAVVFAQEGLQDTMGVTAELVTVIIPEPATMSMLALGGLAALIRRRRS